jgi:hypothetical protein
MDSEAAWEVRVKGSAESEGLAEKQIALEESVGPGKHEEVFLAVNF